LIRARDSQQNKPSLSFQRWPNFNIHHEPDCRRRCYADSREFSLCAFSAHTSEQKAAAVDEKSVLLLGNDARHSTMGNWPGEFIIVSQCF